MDSEIELKLLVASDAEKIIRKQFVPSMNVSYQHESIQLCNTYYDTPEQLLRQYGMGLRIRGNNGEYEQTMKCKDGSVGGLHRRAEHNVPLSSNNLDIMRFPKHIWPQECSLDELNGRLSTLFTTHFRREQYLLNTSEQDQVEMVFDFGEIETDKHQTPVCEVELELKKGSSQALFDLAKALFNQVPFRLGYKSKAQRGYELFEGAEAESDLTLQEFDTDRQAQIADSFFVIATSLLERWQYFEQRYVEFNKPKDIVEMVKVLRLLSRCLTLFETRLSGTEFSSLTQDLRLQMEHWEWVRELTSVRELLSKKGFYRKKLMKHDVVIKHLQARQVSLLQENKPAQLLTDKSYIMLQLDFIRVLAQRLWSIEPSAEDNAGKFAKKSVKHLLNDITQNFKFARDRALRGYLAGFAQLQDVGYANLLVGQLLGSRTGQQLNTWIDLLEGADELKTLNFLESQLRKLVHDSKDGLIEWCVAKQESLLKVMELSRHAALSAAEEAST